VGLGSLYCRSLRCRLLRHSKQYLWCAIMLVFGVIGYLFEKGGFPRAPSCWRSSWADDWTKSPAGAGYHRRLLPLPFFAGDQAHKPRAPDPGGPLFLASVQGHAHGHGGQQDQGRLKRTHEIRGLPERDSPLLPWPQKTSGSTGFSNLSPAEKKPLRSPAGRAEPALFISCI